MKLDKGADLEMHIARVSFLLFLCTEAFQQLNNIGKDFRTEDWHVTVLLGSLPENFDTLVTALESRESELTTTVVEQRLLDEWNKRKDKNSGETDGAVALHVNTNSRDKYRQDIVLYFCKEK